MSSLEAQLLVCSNHNSIIILNIVESTQVLSDLQLYNYDSSCLAAGKACLLTTDY